MRFSILILPVATSLIQPALAWHRGYNFKSNTADGSGCKSASDWQHDFTSVKGLPNGINTARLFNASACNTLIRAVPQAIAAGLQVLVGLDDSDDVFSAEKGALIDSIEEHGWSWLVGVSVGSESLYRGEISPQSLASKIRDVRGMLEGLDGYPGESGVEIGHVDTTNMWFDEGNAPVVRACDFIGLDVYPYFDDGADNHIDNAGTLFDQAIAQAKQSVAAAGSNASVWVTETGWPVSGSQKGNAVPGVSNAASYFQQVACPSFGAMNTFWFTWQDWYATPSFAVVDAQGSQYFSQTCSSSKRRHVEF